MSRRSPEERRRLRATFEQVPQLYDRARPSYPDEVFDDIAELGALAPGAHLLEIGCGTGQATARFAERGFRVTCIELGDGLAAVARSKLSRYDSVDVVVGDFETWEPAGTFDAVVAFTAFHWVDPELRYSKTARLLRDGGVLAVIETEHVRNDDPFWIEMQADYDDVVPDPRNAPPPLPEDVGDLGAEIDATGLFEMIAVRRHARDVTYTADAYIDVLSTYSPNLILDDATRRRLFDRIRARIERRGGEITKPYLFVVNVARLRRSGSAAVPAPRPRAGA